MGAIDPSGETTDPRPEYVCRRCDRPFSRRDGALRCPHCSLRVPVTDGIPRFPVPEEASSTETVFDRLAPIYETPLWFAPLYRFVGGPAAPRNDREEIATLLELESGSADATVLDVACGTGRITRHVAGDAASVVGVDVSEGMLERAQRYAVRDGIENVAFARMSADDLWIDADAFDRVTCCWALHILPDVDAALEEIARVLKPGGSFVGTALVDEYVLDLPPVRTVARGALDADPFEVEDLRDRFQRAGFSSVGFDRRGAAVFVRAHAE